MDDKGCDGVGWQRKGKEYMHMIRYNTIPLTNINGEYEHSL